MSDLTGITLGRYRILERIGRGGMAEVYKAYQPSLDRYVAVKVLHPFLLEEAGSRERFQREARAVAMLRHPNIVQVFDFDTEGDRYFMVMEFVDGPNLKAVLQEQAQQGGHLPLARIDAIITAIGGALGYAHGQGMIHRDVKPHNILFTPAGQPLLTDFGIAKIVSGAQVSASGALSGTPAYMSPEQGRGAPLDARTDLYSLGVVLYEMVTGRVPFDADTPFAVVIKHINDPLPLPHTVNPAVPEALERVILKALAKTPDERFQTAEEMVAATQQAIREAQAAPAPDAAQLAPLVASGENATIPVASDGIEPAAQTVPAPESVPAASGTLHTTPLAPVDGPPVATTPVTVALAEDTPPAPVVAPLPPPPVAPPRTGATAAFSMGKVSCSMAIGVLAVLVLLVGGGLLLRPGAAPLSSGAAPPPSAVASGGPAATPPALAATTEATAAPSSTLAVSPTATLDINAYPDAASAIQQGASLLTAKKYEAAALAYRVAVARDPQNADALLGLGQALLGLQHYADAGAAFTAALAARPGDADALVGRAQASLGLQNWSDALNDANRVLAQDKTNVGALLVHARASGATSDWATADADYQAALAAQPNDPQVLQARGEAYLDEGDKVVEARATLQQAVKADPTDPLLWIDLGRAYVTYQDNLAYEPDQAFQAFSQALTLDPQNGDAYHRRGMVYLDFKSDLTGAIDDLTQAIKIGPATALLYSERARCYAGLKDDKNQLADLDRAITAEPTNPQVYQWQYLYYFARRDYAQAAADLTRELPYATDYQRVGAYTDRSQLYLLLNDLPHAEADARQAIATDPAYADGYALLAAVLRLQKKYPEALAQANQAVAATQHAQVSADTALALRGWVQLDAGQPGPAATDFVAALQIDSGNNLALLGQGAIALARKDYAAALQAIQAGISEDDRYGLGYLLRAQVEQAQGDQAAATKDVQAAQDRILYPDEQATATTLLQQLKP